MLRMCFHAEMAVCCLLLLLVLVEGLSLRLA